MVAFPNCKINLGLNIVRKRDDGFHDLETVFYPLPICDVLEVIHDRAPVTDISFSSSGLPVQGALSDNLCIRAYRLLKQDFPDLPPVAMHLHKAIPMGAGLGGGSSDAAFVLKMLNEKFNLGVSAEKLKEYALALGSDCPFFLHNKPCFASGRGEALDPIELDLSAYSFLVIHPGIHVNTGWAFSQLTPAPPKKPVKEIISQPVSTWKQELVNDFETPVFSAHPQIGALKEKMYAAGAIYASMSGSGSTVFGIFEKDADLSSFRAEQGSVFII